MLQPEVIVELGTHYGHSTVCMALAAKEISTRLKWNYEPHITTIDSYGEWPDRIDRYRIKVDEVKAIFNEYGVGDYITVIKSMTAEAGRSWDGPKIDLLFFDGDHTYKGLMEEYYSWVPHVRKGGLMIFRYHERGIRRFIDEKLRNENVELIGLDTVDKFGLVIAHKL